MATIINNPAEGTRYDARYDSAVGVLVAVALALVLVSLFFVYGLPALRAYDATSSGQAPVNNNPSVNITLPPLVPTSTTGTAK